MVTSGRHGGLSLGLPGERAGGGRGNRQVAHGCYRSAVHNLGFLLFFFWGGSLLNPVLKYKFYYIPCLSIE